MDISFGPHIVNIMAALIGVVLTIYIYYKKRTHQAMVCPLNGNCETVIHSEFSKFFGIPVELLGMFYYATVAMAYSFFVLAPDLTTPLMTVATFFASTLAFLFSVYLIFIQIFYIKQFCTWCVGSACLSTVIFVFSMYIFGGEGLLLIAPYLQTIISLYMLALALGVGSATFSIIFLVKFLRDLHVSSFEAELMRAISQITWLSLAILSMTGTIAFVLPGNGTTPTISTIHIAMLLVTICAGALLDLLVTPRLVSISAGQDHAHHIGELHLLRRSALAFAAIILVSWYMSLALETITPLRKGLDSQMLLIIYGGCILVGLIGSGFIELALNRRVS